MNAVRSSSQRSEPVEDCPLCPRLAEFRRTNRTVYPDYFNNPVPSFGNANARLLIVGLAPGLHGANRTGRPFTGDYAGDLLYATLLSHGLARGTYDQRADDGLELIDCAIANAVRCVPPENKPMPAEINTCRQFLTAQIASMPQLRAILALGKIAHDSVCSALAVRKKDFVFAHGAQHRAGKLALISSYHCSRYNTNTGVLTAAMFDDVVGGAKRAAQGAQAD
ncbi:MAG: uracil-DNA glycosylase [Rhizomicrobium sp.]|jgi:uracil-DNA glycosylase family 4